MSQEGQPVYHAVFSLSQTLPQVTRLTENIPREAPCGRGPYLHFSASQPQCRPCTPASQHQHVCRVKGSLAPREQKGKVGNESTFLEPNFENVPCSRSQPDTKMYKSCLVRHQRGRAHLRGGDSASKQGTVLYQLIGSVS